MSKENKDIQKINPIKRKQSRSQSNENKNEEDKQFKAKMKKKYLDEKNIAITKEVSFNKSDIKYNTPINIKYKGKEFKIDTRKYYEQYQSTWKCINYRRRKDIPENEKKFCNATIKGIRYLIENKLYEFYLMEDHTKQCKNLDNQKDSKLSKEKNMQNSIDHKENDDSDNKKKTTNKDSDDDLKEENNQNKIDLDISDDYPIDIIIDTDIKEKAKECTTLNQMDNFVLEICKKKRDILSNLKNFQRTFKKLYDKNNIKIKENHFKYIFTKYKKICFPETLDEIYNYSNYFEDIGYFCRSISKSQLLNNKGEIIDHSHIILFTESIMKRLITSENILIDGTFTYPKDFYQTIIIMFYDPICFKMIPGIFIAINNKTLEGYQEIFRYIRNYIFNYIQNDLKKIKWKIFTTDFEYSLHTAFYEIFKDIKNLKHKGCFFHYMKNIRKYLVKNGFTKKINEEKYKYIINECYKLPFIKNINKIDKEIKKSFSKKKEYDDFLTYFKNQWLDYFKNGSLGLEKLNIKFRTTNSLENFNRIFKNEFGHKGEVDIILYIDKLLIISREQINYFEKILKKQPKKLININKNLDNKKKDKNESETDSNGSFEDEIDNLINEIENDSDNDMMLNEIKSNNSSEGSINIEEENNSNLNKKKGLQWFNNSCSFDSFIPIFIYSIYPNIKEIIQNNLNESSKNDFTLYIKFINEILEKYLNKGNKFYEILDNFNNQYQVNIYNLRDNEKYQFLPIIINYRLLVNIEYFCIDYKIKHFCTGNCKFNNQPIEILKSTPYIDIPLVAYEDNLAENIDYLFKNYIYINQNTICQEECCSDVNENQTNWYIKKYEINTMPQILSFNTNVNEYSRLKDYTEFINKIFLDNIILYNTSYKLIAFVTQPQPKHFVSYFKNYFSKFSLCLNNWFKYDDTIGHYKELKNIEISLPNIRSSEAIVLLIYLKS